MNKNPIGNIKGETLTGSVAGTATVTGQVTNEAEINAKVTINPTFAPLTQKDLEQALDKYFKENPIVTEYPELENKPSINDVELVDNKTAEELGLQPKGNYLTEIPKEYVKDDDLEDYAQKKDIPNVPDWAMKPTKPSYTVDEVGADAKGSAAQSLVDSKGYTEQKVSEHNTQLDAHNDIRLFLKELNEKVNHFLDIDDTTKDQASEIIKLIEDNRGLIEQITTDKVNVTDIIDNLSSNVSNKPLSAAQGVALKALVDATKVPTKVSAFENDKGYISQEEMEAIKFSIVDGVLFTDAEYIQGDAKAYIRTDYIPNSNTRIVARLYFNATSTTRCIFGARTSTSSKRLDFGNNSSSKYNFGWNAAATASTLAELSDLFDLEINRNKVYINGEEAVSREDAEWQADYPLAIFGCNTKGDVTPLAPTGSKIEFLQIYEGDELLHNFVPRKHLIDGYGLYDRVTNRFYKNAATSGTFTGA